METPSKSWSLPHTYVLLFLMIFGLTLLNLKYFKSAEEIQQ